MRENADRPLEAIETKMRLKASRIMHEVSLHVNLRRSEPVVRGRVELPTFRFSAGLSFLGPTGSVTAEQPALPAKTPGRVGMPWCREHPLSPRSPQETHN